MRDLETNSVGRICVRYSSALSLFGVIAAGCAAQDANDLEPSGGSGRGTAGRGVSGAAGAANGGSINVIAGSSSTAGSTTAGDGGSPGSSGSGGMVTAGSAGAGGAGGAAGASGAAGAAGAGGKGGAGGTSGAAGASGAGGSSAAGGKGGAGGGGSGGTGGATGTDCSVVTDCAVQSVCDAGKCRARGCDASNCAYDLTNFILGTPVAASARGQAFVTWDATSLKVDFQIFDKTPENDSALNWEDDSAEIYLDLNHARSGAYDADDYQINIPRDAGALVGLGTGLNLGAITVVRSENANGYELQVTLPWSALNGAGSQVSKLIGFDLALNDDRDAGTRETQVILYGNENAYQDSKQFGDLTLTP